MKTYLYILLLLSLGLNILSGAAESWTSSTGSEIEGRYLGTTESKHWIIGVVSGRLFKLSEGQLSEESLKKIEKINEKKKLKESRGQRLSVLVSQDMDLKSEDAIIALSTEKISNISFQSVSVESALQTIADKIELDLSFEFTDESLRTRIVSIQLRNLYVDEVMDHMLHQVGLCYRISDGTITITPNHG